MTEDIFYVASQHTSNPNPKTKKLYPKTFLIFSENKIYPNTFLYIRMKPDLTYYHNSWLTLENFLYFPVKNFPTANP